VHRKYTNVFPDYRNDLNTFAARRGLQVTYEDNFEGPQHDGVWCATVYGEYIHLCQCKLALNSYCSMPVDQVDHGHGRATDRGSAREAAAKEALESLE
jgi:hypothetical protein